MRIDVLDLGSNTFHLLSADVRDDGSIVELHDEKISVRLGERAFSDGRISPEGERAALEAVRKLLARLPDATGRLEIVATSVFRETVNGKMVVEEIERRFGARVRILSGAEEARLSFAGIRSEISSGEETVAAFDLGGGSLECMLGGDRLDLARSFPLGALRLRDRWLSGSEAPDEGGIRAVRDAVRDAIEPTMQAIRRAEPEAIVFSSGTARALLKLARRLGHSEDVKGVLGRQTIFQLAMMLSSLGSESVKTLGVEASRADTIGVGALVFSTVLQMVGAPFARIAQRSLREGVALEAAGIEITRMRSRAWASA